MKEREQDIVNSIVYYIQLLGGVATRINSGMKIVEGANGRTHAFKGAPAGTADIIACMGGKYWAIECKRPGERQSDKQQAFLDSVIEADGIAMVAYSVDDVRAELLRQGYDV
jgi:hypothetical protein